MLCRVQQAIIRTGTCSGAMSIRARELLLKASKIKIYTAMGLVRLRASCLEKEKILTNAMSEIAILGTTTSSKKLLNDLRRRVSQQKAISPSAKEAIQCICLNSHNLSWEAALFELEMQSHLAPLDFSQLVKVYEALECEVALSISDVMELVESADACGIIEQTTKLLPVMWLQQGEQSVIINLHEMILDGDVIEQLLSLDEASESVSPIVRIPTATMMSTDSRAYIAKPRGRPSIVSKFPQIPQLVTDFIKQHGYSAQSRRRTAIGSACGVSLEDIRQYLISKIPELQGKGIGRTTVAYLMAPPRRGTTAATRYKTLVSAHVPAKCNQYHENHEDQHYLFARVAYRREFTMKFKKEAAIFSCDDMNKIKVGSLAVSRYHQIYRYFHQDDQPNYPDHDFPLPRYLLIPSGYMLLESKGNCEPVDIPDCFTAIEVNDTCTCIQGQDDYHSGTITSVLYNCIIAFYTR